jgi:hypothetical protein
MGAGSCLEERERTSSELVFLHLSHLIFTREPNHISNAFGVEKARNIGSASKYGAGAS